MEKIIKDIMLIDEIKSMWTSDYSIILPDNREVKKDDDFLHSLKTEDLFYVYVNLFKKTYYEKKEKIYINPFLNFYKIVSSENSSLVLKVKGTKKIIRWNKRFNDYDFVINDFPKSIPLIFIKECDFEDILVGKWFFGGDLNEYEITKEKICQDLYFLKINKNSSIHIVNGKSISNKIFSPREKICQLIIEKQEILEPYPD